MSKISNHRLDTDLILEFYGADVNIAVTILFDAEAGHDINRPITINEIETNYLNDDRENLGALIFRSIDRDENMEELEALVLDEVESWI